MHAKQALQESYVLHTRAYRETSLLVEMFSREHGIVSLIAKGARRAKSRIKSQISPFRKLSVSWISRASDLMTLVDIEEYNHGVINLQGDALYCGMYVNELIIRLLHHHDPHPQLFHDYEQTLTALANRTEIEKTLRVFEKRLLEHLGYGLNLYLDINSQEALDPNLHYQFNVDEGASASSQSTLTFSGRALIALANEDLQDPVIMKECKRFMRTVLNYYLGNKPLKSRDLLINHF